MRTRVDPTSSPRGKTANETRCVVKRLENLGRGGLPEEGWPRANYYTASQDPGARLDHMLAATRMDNSGLYQVGKYCLERCNVFVDAVYISSCRVYTNQV